MGTWRVGKTMVGHGKPSVDIVAQSERQAQYKLGQIARQTALSYELVAVEGDPNGWRVQLLALSGLVTVLEQGRWPEEGHGLNWVWSLPWGSDTFADRDLWVFWAKREGGDDGSDGNVVALNPTPRGGAARELAVSGAAA